MIRILRGMIFSGVLAACLGFSSGGRAQEVVKDLPYVTGGSPSQQLDLYLPAPEAKKHPLVIWIHGGGWTNGSKSENPGKRLLAMGYAVASLNYRLSQEAIYPAQIEDCKAAVRWLRAHVTPYGIDPHRVGAWGASAGGHLVALLGTTSHARQFEVGENLDQSSAVQCVIDGFGPADFLHWGDAEPPNFEDAVNNPLARLLGGAIRTHLELAREASPVDFVDKDAAPFLIMHGDKDPTVPLQQSQELDAALRKAGVESTLDVLPGAGHGGPQFTNPDSIQLMLKFLGGHLGMSTVSPTN